jgi:hypothetical protein
MDNDPQKRQFSSPEKLPYRYLGFAGFLYDGNPRFAGLGKEIRAN